MYEPGKQEKVKVKQVLLADDDQDDIDLFKEAVEGLEEQVEITVAKNGEQAIAILKSDEMDPDLVFLDINMPLKNGFECMEEIQSLSNEDDIPVILLSTHQNDELVKRAKALGAAGYIKKATSFLKYKTTIHDVLSRNWKTGIRMDFYVA